MVTVTPLYEVMFSIAKPPVEYNSLRAKMLTTLA